MASHRVAVLLKVRSSIGENETSDKQRHVASRFLPWFKSEDLAKDSKAVFKKLMEDFDAASKAGSISGVSTEGEAVEDKPFTTKGTGKGDNALSYELIEKLLARGLSLVNQQQMHEKLAEKYGRTDKPKAGKTPAATEEDY